MLNSEALKKEGLFIAVVSIAYNITGNSVSDLSTACSRNKSTELGIVGVSGLTSVCSVRQSYVAEGKVYISVYNRGTGASSGTCNVRVLYKAK